MPVLTLRESAGIAVLTDAALQADRGILVAFTLRTGGYSAAPYSGLNLASHVGDDPDAVDANRSALLSSVGLSGVRERLVTAQQVHGPSVFEVLEADAGSGAVAAIGSRAPFPAADGLLTTVSGVPLMLLFADCVPIVLVAKGPRRAVAVVHAGWRGALAGIAATGARKLATAAGCAASDVVAYIGPHIQPCHYPVGETLVSQFFSAFGAGVVDDGRLDLGVAVSRSLEEAGVPVASLCRADVCTAERTDAFFSYRAEGLTGRHGALVCILGDPA